MSGFDGNAVRTWIFQGDPAVFDMDGYLSSRPDTFVWFVNQHATEIVVGDRVFMWRAIGDLEREMSGVIAEASVLSPVSPLVEDSRALPFWRNPALALQERNRVRLQLLRYADRTERLQRDQLYQDPVLHDLNVLRRPFSGTNFSLSPAQAMRLDELWTASGAH